MLSQKLCVCVDSIQPPLAAYLHKLFPEMACTEIVALDKKHNNKNKRKLIVDVAIPVVLLTYFACTP